MINVKLLGGVKKAVGKASISLDEPSLSIAEILMLLRHDAQHPRIFSPNNILVAVNGVESSSLDGNDTVVENGDTVTIVTVVHGGSKAA